MGPPGLEPGTKGFMRAGIQRKLVGFQEVTVPQYRCVVFCVVDLMKLEELLTHSLVFKTKGFLE